MQNIGVNFPQGFRHFLAGGAQYVFLLLIALLVSAPTSVFAEGEKTVVSHPHKPFLWKVTGESITGDVYLFGTAHFADQRITTLHPLAEKAFVLSRRLYTESDLSGRNNYRLQKFSERKDSKTLSQVLDIDTFKMAKTELGFLSKSISIEDYEKKKIWALWLSLNQLVHKGDGNGVLDQIIHNRAIEMGKSVLALESVEEQFANLNKLSESKQIGILKGYLKRIRQARLLSHHPSQSIFSAYLNGDEVAMISAANIPQNKNLTTFQHTVYTARNKGMAKKIEGELLRHPEKNHFFAVGVSHFLGYNSIIKLLEKQGYSINRIK